MTFIIILNNFPIIPLEYKERLSKIKGVEEITWLDDAADINRPLEMIGAKTLDSWYKDNNALFTALVDTEGDLKTTISAIRDIIGGKGTLSGWKNLDI